MQLTVPKTITHALKEWAIAVDALLSGKTIMLLRKGGIREQGGVFKVAQHHVLLYPTYEHQQSHLLKLDYSTFVQTVPSGWHPDMIKISAWAEITDVFPVMDEQKIAAILPYHIWNSQFICDRLKWKAQQPLYILLLRTYKLSSTYMINYHSEYGGCKSWINLAEAINIESTTPVLTDAEYIKQVTDIWRILSI